MAKSYIWFDLSTVLNQWLSVTAPKKLTLYYYYYVVWVVHSRQCTTVGLWWILTDYILKIFFHFFSSPLPPQRLAPFEFFCFMASATILHKNSPILHDSLIRPQISTQRWRLCAKITNTDFLHFIPQNLVALCIFHFHPGKWDDGTSWLVQC